MSYQTQGIVRGYDPATDSATVEIGGLGAIDQWLSGVGIEAPINRAYVRNGVPCTVSMPDAHRLCEVKIISLTDTPQSIAQNQSGATTSNVSAQTGTATLTTDGLGEASQTVTFSPPFSAVPIVSVAKPLPTGQLSVSGITSGSFAVSLTGYYPQTVIGITWAAVGPS